MPPKVASILPVIWLHAVLTGSLAAINVLHAQGTSKLIYDVTTVKPHSSADPGMSWGAQNGNLRAMNVNLRDLIADASGVRPDQVAGEPAWADEEHWDVTGKLTDTQEDVLKKLSNPVCNCQVDYGDRAEHCWNGDHTQPNYISRLRYNQMFIKKWAEEVKTRAPKGVDLKAWRY